MFWLIKRVSPLQRVHHSTNCVWNLCRSSQSCRVPFSWSVTIKTQPSSLLCHSNHVKPMPLALEAKEPFPRHAASQVSFPGDGDWSGREFQILACQYIYVRLSKSFVLRAMLLLLPADGKISIICKVVPDFCENYKNHTPQVYVTKCIYLFCREVEAANCYNIIYSLLQMYNISENGAF